MSLDVRAMRWAIAVLTTAVALSAMAAEKGWVTLRGNALTQAIANQDFGDGVHFAYQFLAGGELHGMNMGKPTLGDWRVAGNQLCWRWKKPEAPEECHEVRQHAPAALVWQRDLVPAA